MKYIKELCLSGLLTLSACQEDIMSKHFYTDPGAVEVRREKLGKNEIMRIIQEVKKGGANDFTYNIEIIGTDPYFYLSVRNLTRSNCPDHLPYGVKIGDKGWYLCDYLPK